MDKLLTTDELAEALRTSPNTVRFWRQIGYGVRGVKVGRRVLYRESEVAAFVAERFAAEAAGEGAA